MKSTKSRKNFLLTLPVIFFVFINNQLISQISPYKFPRPARRMKFSDEVLIKSLIYKFEQSVKNEDEKLFERIISKDIQDSTGTVIGKKELKQKFIDLVKNQNHSFRSKYSQRRTPKMPNIRANWDFEIEIKDINIFKNMKNAFVQCEMYFAMDQPDDIPEIRYAKKPKKIEEQLVLKKLRNKWKISKIKNFFKFIEERKKKLMEK